MVSGVVCTLLKYPFNFIFNQCVLNRAKVLKLKQRARPAEPFERVESHSDLIN